VSLLDPARVLENLRSDLPARHHRSFVVVGSLAAAYHFRRALASRAIRTKDADLVVFHAGDVRACQAMAGEFLDRGWTPRESYGSPRPRPRPLGTLPFIRLYPPGSRQYFIEFLGLPGNDPVAPKAITPVRLPSGWHGIPRFRFMGAVAHGPRRSESGLLTATPSMMALSNLLSHRSLGMHRVSQPLGGRKVLRSSKDLGRVLAIAFLTPREERETWAAGWRAALEAGFPRQWRGHARRCGLGLEALLRDPAGFREAHHAATFGLLAGLGATEDALRGAAEQLLADVLVPLREQAGAAWER